MTDYPDYPNVEPVVDLPEVDPVEVVELVTAATGRNVFRLEDYRNRTRFPKKDVTVYTDLAAAYELSETVDAIKVADEDDVAELEAKAQELADQVQASKLVFTIQGFDGSVHKEVLEQTGELSEDGDINAWNVVYTDGLLARSISAIRDSEGRSLEGEIDREFVRELREHVLPMESYVLLTTTMQKVVMATGYFKNAVDSGFFPKS